MYLLDANIFIQAKNFYYSFDICPGFWDWMDQVCPDGEVKSIRKVCDELCDGTDDLADWIKDRKRDGRFLENDDEETQRAFREVAAFVQGGRYKQTAKNRFLEKADPWLVAKARMLGAVVVTHEVPAPDALNRVPLPNICEEFGVEVIDTYDLLRRNSTLFVV